MYVYTLGDNKHDIYQYISVLIIICNIILVRRDVYYLKLSKYVILIYIYIVVSFTLANNFRYVLF